MSNNQEGELIALLTGNKNFASAESKSKTPIDPDRPVGSTLDLLSNTIASLKKRPLPRSIEDMMASGEISEEMGNLAIRLMDGTIKADG